MNYLIGSGLLVILFLMWQKIRSWFYDRKIEELKDEASKERKNADEAVGSANSAYDEFMQLLRKYKRDSDNK